MPKVNQITIPFKPALPGIFTFQNHSFIITKEMLKLKLSITITMKETIAIKLNQG